MQDISQRPHRFKVGAVVSLKTDMHRREAAPHGVFKVVRLLPAEGQDYQYRIKDSRTGREHAVMESQLT
jgi:hypothetical protein